MRSDSFLDKGEIAETGTHKELVEKKGAYFSLVKDQLELGTESAGLRAQSAGLRAQRRKHRA
jgi:ABC-type transport system involved in cytochrome bd biosynthesis fused ATPase/permease subunit